MNKFHEIKDPTWDTIEGKEKDEGVERRVQGKILDLTKDQA